MTLTNPQSIYTYTPSAQSEEQFPFPALFFRNGDLTVTVTDSDGDVTTVTESVDYSVYGAGSVNGGIQWIGTSPDGTNKVTITRWVDFTQEADYLETGTFPAESHEQALDRLAMQTQQLAERSGGTDFDGGSAEALRRSASNVEEWDAKSGKIVNAANPTDAQDVATKAYADGLIVGGGDLPPQAPTDDRAVIQTDGANATWKGAAVPEPAAADADVGKVLTVTGSGENKGANVSYEWLDVSLPTANVVINGGMRIQQRRSPVAANMIDGVFVIDRWHHQMEVQNSITITQVNKIAAGQVGPDLIPPGAYSAMQITYATAGPSGKHAAITFLESRDVADIIKDGTGDCSLSFKARMGPGVGTGTIRAAVCQWEKDASTDNIDTPLVSSWGPVGTAPSLGNGWSYVTGGSQNVNIPIDENWQTIRIEDLQFNDPDTRNVAVIIWYDADDLGLNEDWLITEVQLLPTPKAAARFEYKALGEERLLCERYFECSYEDGVWPDPTTGQGPAATEDGAEYFVPGFTATEQPFIYAKVGFRTQKFIPAAGLGVKIWSPVSGDLGKWADNEDNEFLTVTGTQFSSGSYHLNVDNLPQDGRAYRWQWSCEAEL